MQQRLAALVALGCMAAIAVLLLLVVPDDFPRGLEVVLLVMIALFAAWSGIRRRGGARTLLLSGAVAALAASVVALIVGGVILEAAVALALVALLAAAMRRAFAIRARRPQAAPPRRAVVVWNPRSGGGRALQADLAEQARARGIEPIELGPGDDLEQLVRAAVARGADGVMAAGGDGTQAIVAAVAAEHDLPFACVPAGTRNHFALDLGVDRNDVVGALDAFVDGGERLVDLAEVNGHVFVNNVSLGLYAEAVQSTGYRDAKLRTILDTAPDVFGVDGDTPARALRCTGPDGTEIDGAAVILVSNNSYRLGRMLGSGTRPRIDDGELGVAVLAPRSRQHRGLRAPWQQWATRQLDVSAEGPVPIGIDGEAMVLDPPLRFRVRPGALRVRVARRHPGVSPSAALPSGLRDTLVSLVRIAAGQDPSHLRHLGDLHS